MNLLKKIKRYDEKLPISDTSEPVTYETVENAVKLIQLANEIGADFDFALALSKGAFTMDATMFRDINLSKATKTQSAKIVIKYIDGFMEKETTIELQFIKKVIVNVTLLQDGLEE